MRSSVWVLEHVEGLRCVLDHKTMVVPEQASSRVQRVALGDWAIIHRSSGAFHNPARDASRLNGVRSVAERPRERVVATAGRKFTFAVAIAIAMILRARTGPPRESTGTTAIGRQAACGLRQHCQSSPIAINEHDFAAMEDTRGAWKAATFEEPRPQHSPLHPWRANPGHV